MSIEMDINDREIDEIRKNYLEKVYFTVPDNFIKHLSGVTLTQQGDERPQISFNLPGDYSQLKDTEYYYTESKKFIHFTSLQSAINILNDGYFRLNSLSYMDDDPNELLFAGRQILGNYDAADLRQLKERIFCFSFCKYDDQIESPENFDLWRLYGDNGLGIGIVFNLGSSYDSWRDNFISKVYYGDKTTQKFETIRQNHDKFISEYGDKFDLKSSSFGSIGKLPKWIAPFLAFHKNSLYEIENEVRFLRFGDSLSYDELSFTLNKKFEKTLYDKLLIKTVDNLKTLNEKSEKFYTTKTDNIQDLRWLNEVTKRCPVAEIEQIVVGYRHANNFSQIWEALNEGLKYKGIYSVEVNISKFSDLF